MHTLNDSTAHFSAPLIMFYTELEALIERLGRCSRFGFSQISCAFSLLVHEKQSRTALEAIRMGVAWCSDACPTAECLVNAGAVARMIRDNYLKLLDILPRFGPLSILRGRMERSLYAWDDLVEDCTVGSDHEIRQTLIEIAKRV